MYKNIVFDLGGVVVDYDPKEYLMERFYHERTEHFIYNAVFGSAEWVLMDQGKLAWKDAVEIFMARGVENDLAFEMKAVLSEWTELLQTRKATVNLIRILKKKGFRVYYLSNMSAEVLAYLKRRDYFTLFDGGIASYEVGLLKPDVEIYQLLIDQYQLVPQETIFTDDHKANSAAAFQAGITGIQFLNVKNFCKMLVTYGIDL